MMRSKFLFFLFLIAFVAIFAVGCNRTDEKATIEPREGEEEKTADTATDPTLEPTDREVTAGVKEKLMTDENVAARRIEVNTENGVVTLRGTVATPTEADRAVELAKTADGVRLVQSYLKNDSAASSGTKTGDDELSDLGEQAQDALNEAGGAIETGIEQAEDVGSDAAITAQIKWKLAKDKLVQAADIDVDTKDRRVTLTGTVASQQEAQRALQIAQSIEDVLGVDNNLRVR
jgi:hyperosmotically inducible periplasmic protein